jgi:hypothetical protein
MMHADPGFLFNNEPIKKVETLNEKENKGG